MNQPKISVIVPVYKVEPYLRKCLDSIVNQTYTNLEIILVDDGSPDNCPAICDEYAAKDARITVIHQANAGVSAARNAALNIAAGDYIGFVDSDDWLEPDMYEYLLELAENYTADITQCGIHIEDNGRSYDVFVHADEAELFCCSDMTEKAWEKISYGACNKLYRSATVNGLRFRPEYNWGEDLLFNVDLILRASNICLGSKAKYFYYYREGSACNQPVSPAYYRNCQRALLCAETLLADKPASFDFFRKSQVLNTLDLCSKVARNQMQELQSLKKDLRAFLRKNLPTILRTKALPLKERTKSLLIAYAWWLYRPLLKLSKRICPRPSIKTRRNHHEL